MKKLFNKFLCWLDIHDGKVVDLYNDKFAGMEGHMGTIKCTRCSKMRRVLGHNDKVTATLPWLNYP
jgi:hypothetical protein